LVNDDLDKTEATLADNLSADACAESQQPVFVEYCPLLERRFDGPSPMTLYTLVICAQYNLRLTIIGGRQRPCYRAITLGDADIGLVQRPLEGDNERL